MGVGYIRVLRGSASFRRRSLLLIMKRSSGQERYGTTPTCLEMLSFIQLCLWQFGHSNVTPSGLFIPVPVQDWCHDCD